MISLVDLDTLFAAIPCETVLLLAQKTHLREQRKHHVFVAASALGMAFPWSVRMTVCG